MKLSFAGGDSGSRKADVAVVGPGGVYVWRDSGVSLSVLCNLTTRLRNML
jgi:hypothetical protein